MTNKYNDYLNKEIYENLEDPLKAQLHRIWRNDKNITIEVLKEKLGINEHSYYKELERLGVDYKKRSYGSRKRKSSKKTATACEISFNGIYDPESLLEQLERIKPAINPRAAAYEFKICIKEIAE